MKELGLSGASLEGLVRADIGQGQAITAAPPAAGGDEPAPPAG
jgi:hypothetical protein